MSGGAFLFTVAGGDLCRMKADVLGYANGVRPDIYVMQKPQKILDSTNLVTGDELEEVEDDDDADDDMFDQGASAFDGKSPTTSNRKRKPSPTPDVVVKRQQSEASSPSWRLTQPATPMRRNVGRDDYLFSSPP
ncbi:hypothetical protein LTS10_003126 [Elasticomyces elasticus]|nr:hypothetical protein LTS10_003126 [Elasticomyces elasticus]